MAVDSNDREKSSNELEIEILQKRIADEETSEVDRKAFEKELAYYQFLAKSEKDED